MLWPGSQPFGGVTYVGPGTTAYTNSASLIDSAATDVLSLQSKGWINLWPSGPTSTRPLTKFGLYLDWTISRLIVGDGSYWRDAWSNAII
jgi:hypothetical protein